MHTLVSLSAVLGLASVTVVGIAPTAQAVVTRTSAPTAVRAAPGNLTATVGWAPPRSTGGAPVTSYHLYLGGISKEVSATTRQLTFTRLRAGWTYKAYVSARNAAGRSVEATVLVTVYPAATRYANCTAVNRVYPHGIGRTATARDHTSGTPVRTFYVSRALFDLNRRSDRDKDAIACERL